jgi:hypothetical protein
MLHNLWFNVGFSADWNMYTVKISLHTKRKINEYIISEFKLNLSYESWDEIFTDGDVDTIFNSFLNTCLRRFYHSFPHKKFHYNYWIMNGIKISSQ